MLCCFLLFLFIRFVEDGHLLGRHKAPHRHRVSDAPSITTLTAAQAGRAPSSSCSEVTRTCRFSRTVCTPDTTGYHGVVGFARVAAEFAAAGRFALMPSATSSCTGTGTGSSRSSVQNRAGGGAHGRAISGKATAHTRTVELGLVTRAIRLRQMLV